MASLLGTLWPSLSPGTSNEVAHARAASSDSTSEQKDLVKEVVAAHDDQPHLSNSAARFSGPNDEASISTSSVAEVAKTKDIPSTIEHTTIDAMDESDTPKAVPQPHSLEVPTFSLQEHEENPVAVAKTVDDSARDQQRGLRAATQQVRQMSSLAPPTRPTGSLMPPPAPSLRVPTTGPLPNRGPPTNSQQRVGSNSRGKVLLSPGHSPMDWAALTRSNNLSGVANLQRVTPSQMRSMNGRKGKPIWSSYQGKVYNISPYLPFHPGGEKELMKAAGRDGTKLFMDIHPWVAWESMLSSCLVGILVSEGADEGLDAID